MFEYEVEFENYAGSKWLAIVKAKDEDEAVNITIKKNRKKGSGTARVIRKLSSITSRKMYEEPGSVLAEYHRNLKEDFLAVEHEYLLEVDFYFDGAHRFMVTAESKEDAIRLAKETTFYKTNKTNLIEGSLRVVRKLKPSS